MVRIGAKSKQKYVLGYCRGCQRPRWLRVTHDRKPTFQPEQLGAQTTANELRQPMRASTLWSLLTAVVFGTIIATLTSLPQSPGKRTNASPVEAFYRKLPKDWTVTKSIVLEGNDTKSIGRRLGGCIDRLTNTFLSVDGRTLQINCIHCPTDQDVASIYAALTRNQRNSRSIYRDGRMLAELLCDDVRLSLDARNRLFLPSKVRYRVSFDAAPLQSCDYMEINELFNLFLQYERDTSARTEEQIHEKTRGFQFGNQLRFYTQGRGDAGSRFQLTPSPVAITDVHDGKVFSFDKLPNKAGVPYVSVVAEITAQTYHRRKANRDVTPLLRATKHWPSQDAEVQQLAASITKDSETDRARVQAILEWMMPGQNLRYGGMMGSRYGLPKVLRQRFGRCWDFSDCFITLCRASGIPCRQVAGWLHGLSGHVWAEVWLDGAWEAFDPTAGMGCGSDYIPYFVSEDGDMPLLYLSRVKIEILHAEQPNSPKQPQ